MNLLLAWVTLIYFKMYLLKSDKPTIEILFKDTFMAMSLVDLMIDLAASGKTIICTIHQPSTQIFKKFDTLCLLSEGRMAYFGRTVECVNFFNRYCLFFILL